MFTIHYWHRLQTIKIMSKNAHMYQLGGMYTRGQKFMDHVSDTRHLLLGYHEEGKCLNCTFRTADVILKLPLRKERGDRFPRFVQVLKDL